MRREHGSKSHLLKCSCGLDIMSIRPYDANTALSAQDLELHWLPAPFCQGTENLHRANCTSQPRVRPLWLRPGSPRGGRPHPLFNHGGCSGLGRRTNLGAKVNPCSPEDGHVEESVLIMPEELEPY